MTKVNPEDYDTIDAYIDALDAMSTAAKPIPGMTEACFEAECDRKASEVQQGFYRDGGGYSEGCPEWAQ